MIIKHRNLCWLDIYTLCVVIISLHKIGVLSTGHELNNTTRSNSLEQSNRDGDLPIIPAEPDLRLQSSYIFKAHEILRVGLQQLLAFKDADLGTSLNYLIYKRTEPFVDEYGQAIRNYKKVFRFIWEQHNETLMQNYAIGQFKKDKLYLCSVARYLSHQSKVEQRKTIMKRMSDALNYTCHPCTPYTPKQYDETIVASNTDGSNPEGVSPEESLILCQENNTEGQSSLLSSSSYNSTSPQSGFLVVDSKNDSKLPPSFIIKAHEVIRNGLQEFLNLNDSDLGTCLQYLIYNRTEPFKDEYGQNIRNYKKVLRFIWEQYNETLIQNYAIREFNQDKLQLCSIARYLSHQPTVKDRHTMVERVGTALNYTCHPCTPYTPKQYNETFVSSTQHDNITEEATSENFLALCDESKIKENAFSTSESNPTSTENSLIALKLETSYIVDAHEVLRKGLKQFFKFKDTDLATYLSSLIYKRTEPFVDEYGQIIRNYKKVFQFIWEQHKTILVQNYSIGQFKKDKLDLCSAARYLSHQTTVEQRETIMKRMGDALRYKCHPCTPYTPKQYDETIVPSTDDPEGLSPEESLILCKESQIQGQEGLVSLSNSTTSEGTITTTVGWVKPENPSLDYTPCNYSNGDVICDQVPLEEVQKVFKRSSFSILASVELLIQPYVFSETFIPKDVFGAKRILNIWIGYPDVFCNRSLILQVDADAFRSTKSYTKIFEIYFIDCTLLDLSFLTGFDQLAELAFNNIYNIQHCLSSLPPLPRLTTLYFQYCIGMNHLNIFPTLTNGLKIFKLSGDVDNSDKTYDDETVDGVLDWLLLSSENTLEEMGIEKMNQVTRVPHKIASFKALRALWLTENNISTIKTRAFSFSAPVSVLSIKDNGIKEIESGAFQGDFKNTYVYVYNNNLTRFEESVFGPMLQEMVSGEGFVDAGSKSEDINPIDCSDGSICHLTWLKRYEIDVKFSLKCSNGTWFGDLQPAGFNHCPQTAEFSDL